MAFFNFFPTDYPGIQRCTRLPSSAVSEATCSLYAYEKRVMKRACNLSLYGHPCVSLHLNVRD